MIAYFSGRYLPEEEIKVSPYDRGFQFSDGVYEVVRFYDDHFFQTDAHLRRMARGLSELKIKNLNIAEFKKIIQNLIEQNNIKHTQALAYIQVTRGDYYPRRHWFPPEGTPPTVFITTSLFKPHQDEIDNGVKILLEPDMRWHRCDIKSIALLPNVLARQKAVENGAAETVFVRDNLVTEGTHTNFCVINNGKLYTPPLSNLILPGITREVVLRICDRLNISYHETPIRSDDLFDYDEIMLVGTTVEITPVVQINDQQIGNGQPGPLTKSIQKEFYAMVKKVAF